MFTEKQLEFLKTFRYYNRNEVIINQNSFYYKYNKETINEMLEMKVITLVRKIRNALTFKVNHCYGSDFKIKQRCENLCSFCVNLQKQREIFEYNRDVKYAEWFKRNTENPSKIRQIINIIFKK